MIRCGLLVQVFAAFLSVVGFCSPSVAADAASIGKIRHIVVIYAENRSFDNLYGMFPGANGIANALANYIPQVDHDGTPFKVLPPVWANEQDLTSRETDPTYPATLPNRPFRIDEPPVNHPLDVKTRDLVHRFYQNKEQINGGRNDRFVAMSNAGALVMGYYDGSRLPMWSVAREFTLADNFFMGAFGGSFLNHFWLVCACTPEYRNAPGDMVTVEDGSGRLVRQKDSPKSAMEGPVLLKDGAVTPAGYAVNSVQPPYQPSAIAPAAGGDPALADPDNHHRLPPQTLKTIGDTLSEKGRFLGLVCRRLESGAGGSLDHLQREAGQLPAASPAVQLLRAIRARQRRSREAPAGRRRLPRGHRQRHLAAGGFLQADRNVERASRLHGRDVGRRAHRQDHHSNPQQPQTLGRSRHHRDLRRERRILGSRCRRRLGTTGDRGAGCRPSSSRRSRARVPWITPRTIRRRF